MPSLRHRGSSREPSNRTYFITFLGFKSSSTVILFKILIINHHVFCMHSSLIYSLLHSVVRKSVPVPNNRCQTGKSRLLVWVVTIVRRDPSSPPSRIESSCDRPAHRARLVRGEPTVDAPNVVHVHAGRQLPHHLPFFHRAKAHRALECAAATMLDVLGSVREGRQGHLYSWEGTDRRRRRIDAAGGRGAGHPVLRFGTTTVPSPATVAQHECCRCCDQEDGGGDE